jgi:hypothetical protein
MLNLFQHLIYSFSFQQTQHSSPSLPTGRPAQDRVFKCGPNEAQNSNVQQVFGIMEGVGLSKNIWLRRVEP